MVTGKWLGRSAGEWFADAFECPKRFSSQRVVRMLLRDGTEDLLVPDDVTALCLVPSPINLYFL